MLKRIVFFLFATIVAALPLSAQDEPIGIGDWQVHSAFQTATDLAIAGDEIYCASAVSFFKMNLKDETFTTFSKLDGFAEIGISALAYYEDRELLFVGYTSGNIDIVHENTITNINDIKRSSISGSKQINQITFIGEFAYLACDFGLVLLDLDKLEIKETYRNIGENGIQLEVYNSVLSSNEDSLFLATNGGLLAASLTPGINLLDFNNWAKLTDSNGEAIEDIAFIDFWNDTLCIAINRNGLYQYVDGNMTKLPIPFQGWKDFTVMKADGGKMMWGHTGRLGIMEHSNDGTYFESYLLENPQGVAVDNDGTVWIADLTSGMFFEQNGFGNRRIPNGPETVSAFKFFSHDDQIFSLAGGYSNVYAPFFKNEGLSYRDNGVWTIRSTDTRTIPEEFDFLDINSGAYNPVTDLYYFGGFKTGLLQWDRNIDSFYQWLDTTAGSSLSSALADQPWVKITGIKVDDEGNTWLTNHQTLGDPSLHKIDREGNFQGYTLQNSDGEFPIDIDLGLDGTKWITLAGPGLISGVIAYDETTNSERYLTNAIGNGGFPSSLIRSLEVDKEGAVWVGTTEGVGVFYEPEEVFEGTAFDVTLPIFEGRPLLQDEEVKCIAVDGANRKWFGTANGVFLFDDNATEAVATFNTDNSPMPSNNVIDIEVVEKTGEVFISTDQGMLSYRGTATEGEEVHSDVSIFPNPVTPEFDGLVGISGLATDAVVKITDLGGRLVFETDAEGGLATWDGRDINGVRASTGVYLVFSASTDGEDAYVGKIAVIE